MQPMAANLPAARQRNATGSFSWNTRQASWASTAAAAVKAENAPVNRTYFANNMTISFCVGRGFSPGAVD
jgi:hypothetical protein